MIIVTKLITVELLNPKHLDKLLNSTTKQLMQKEIAFNMYIFFFLGGQVALKNHSSQLTMTIRLRVGANQPRVANQRRTAGSLPLKRFVNHPREVVNDALEGECNHTPDEWSGRKVKVERHPNKKTWRGLRYIYKVRG